MHDVKLLLPFFHKYHVTVRSLSVSLYKRQTALFFFEETWTLKLPGILKLCPRKSEYYREFAIHMINE